MNRDELQAIAQELILEQATDIDLLSVMELEPALEDAEAVRVVDLIRSAIVTVTFP